MNIINRAFLKVALIPLGFYERAGVDIHQLKWILMTKLTMDDRRVSFMQQIRNRKKEANVSRATIGTMVMSAILGVVYLFSFFIGENIVTQLTIYFSLFFFMLSLTLIADFTSVLIDVRDNFIILPKPVSDRTFIVARLLHIFIHVSKIVVPMSLTGLIYMGTSYNILAALLLLVLIFMVTTFSIFFINAVYIIILKITSPQKFQTFISYIQIGFAIIMYGSYQVVPRLMDNSKLENFDINNYKVVSFYPLYWFANLWKVIYHLNGSLKELFTAMLGILTPFASLYIVVKYLAPSFNNKLAMINTSGSTVQKVSAKESKGGFTYSHFLSTIFTRSQAERMGFLFTWKMASRSRDFKLKVYPAIGYLLVYVVIVFLNSRKDLAASLSEQTSEGKMLVISGIYFTSLLLVMALTQMSYSDKYKASWIYYTSPVAQPGEVILGGAKAMIMRFYIPMVVVVTVVALVFVGPKVLPNIILGLFNQLVIAALVVYAGNKVFPFSTHQSNNTKTGSFIRNLFVFFISGLIATGHYFIYDIMPAVILCLLMSGVALWFMTDSIRRISWAAVQGLSVDD